MSNALLGLIRRNRAALADAIGAGRYENFSAANAGRFGATRAVIERHARGRVLDVGCGHMPFRASALASADTYEGLDVEARAEGVTHLGDAQDMTAIPNDAYDTAFCFEVLEHLPRPGRALAEIARVLRPGGTLLLSAPHLSRLHEEPHDYFRFTRHGLRVLMEDAGLEPVEIAPHAGLLSFLAHQLSTVVLGLVWPMPGVRQVAYVLNRLLLVWPVLWLDRLLDRNGLFALGYIAVARKPTASR
ncbi:MAG: class I SAM-dependent methyltransferase [Gemmatimonadaceae bacterium]